MRQQISAQDYERAARLLDYNLRPLIEYANPVCHWLPDRDAFWYARRNADGAVEQVLYDVETKTSAPYQPAVQPKKPALPDACLSPDGARAIFARHHDLWLRDVATGDERRLTYDGVPYFAYGRASDADLVAVSRKRAAAQRPPDGVWWSPDGKFALTLRFDERNVASYPFLESVPLDGSQRPVAYDLRLALVGDAEQPQREYAVIDIEGGAVRKLTFPPGWTITEPNVARSHDLSRLYVLGQSPGWHAGALFEIEFATGAVRTIVHEEAAPQYRPNAFAYSAPCCALVADGEEAIWFSERSGYGHLYLYDGQSGACKRAITSGDWLVRDILRVDGVARQVYFTATGREPGCDPYYRLLYRAALDREEIVLLTPEQAEHELEGPLSSLRAAYFGASAPPSIFSPSGRYFVVTHSTVDTPPVTLVRSVADGAPVAEVQRFDPAALYATGWHPPQRVKVKAADGVTDLIGVVYLPADYAKDRTYPVIDAVYGGPQMMNVPRSFADAASTFNPVARSSLASFGCVVVTLDGRGTRGRSKAFHDVGYGEFAVPQIEDHVTAIRQLAERYGNFDLDRVGVYGHSFGGYVSARAILQRPDFYKVAVSSAGSQNLHGFYSSLTCYFPAADYGGGRNVRPTRDAVPANYRAFDNALLAERLQGKLMLVYGDMDENAMPAVTFQLADALMRADKDFDLLYLPNRTHSFFRDDAYYMRRMWNYFVEHLLDRNPPADFKLRFAKNAYSGGAV